MNGRRLYRSTHERLLGGVAGGIAEYFDLDPSLVRVAWAVLILASGGLFLLLYLVMWVVVPEAHPDAFGSSTWSAGSSPSGADAAAAGAASTGSAQAGPGSHAGQAAASSATAGARRSSIAGDWAARRAERRHRRSAEGGVLVGAVLVLVGVWFLARDYLPWLRVAEVWPLALILVGILLLVGAVRRGTD